MNQEELLNLIDQAAEDGREELDLTGQGLMELPKEIGKMNREELLNLIDQAAEDGREELNLTGQGLTELPKEIGKLKNLTKLSLDYNQISEIPDSISELKNLAELYLVGNQISKISDAISELKNLTDLYLGSNQISQIPDSIVGLKNLTELYLSNNQISEIPDAISELRNLTGLYLHSNQISQIPDAIIKLKNLRILDLGNNLIREIPAEIIQLENLERDQDGMIEGIGIEGNPIINPPYEIVEKGIYAIRSYFLTQQLSRYKDDDTLKIERSIEFPPEYWTAGTSILSYFSHILSVKYPDQNIKVRIEQEGLLLRMIIDTPEGQTELIEQTLNEYSMVITGKLLPKNFLSNPFEVMALENKLENMKSELRQTEKLLSVQKEMFARENDKDRQRIDFLETQLSRLIEKGLNNDILPVVNNYLTVNANDHLSQNNTNQHGQGDNFGGDNVNQDKIGRDKR